MHDVIFATSRELPHLDPDDRLAIPPLEERGVRVRPAVWNDPSVQWDSADACVIRSTWDYYKHPEAFDRWITAVSERTVLLNPPNTVRWNAHKFYLRELEQHGVPVVRTAWLRCGEPYNIDALMRIFGRSDIVIKPALGASAYGVLHVRNSAQERTAGANYLSHLLEKQDVLMQPYLETTTTYYERALVFFNRTYSHAVTKAPFVHANARVGDRAGAQPGSSGEAPTIASDEEIAVAASALQTIPSGHVYARVDIVRDDNNGIRVLEVELIEPTLYLFANSSAPITFAEAIVHRLRS